MDGLGHGFQIHDAAAHRADPVAAHEAAGGAAEGFFRHQSCRDLLLEELTPVQLLVLTDLPFADLVLRYALFLSLVLT